jgi:hypothetical protein
MEFKFSKYVSKDVVIAEEKSLMDEYQEYFQGMLKKYKIGSPAELSKEDMKKFFNDVSDGWEKGVGEK